MRHGVTGKTPDRYLIGPGEIRINYVDGTNPGELLGATLGGNTFTVENEIREIIPDGAKGKVKGMRQYERIDAQLVANMLEVSRDVLLKAIPGAEGEVDGDYYKVTPSTEICDDAYIDNVAILGTVSGEKCKADGKPAVIILKNALADEGMEIAFEDNDDIVLPITFSAHFDADDLEEVPYEIRYPADIVT